MAKVEEVLAEAENSARQLQDAKSKLATLQAQVDSEKVAKFEKAKSEYFNTLVSEKLALPSQKESFGKFSEDVLSSEEKQAAFKEFLKLRGEAYRTETQLADKSVGEMLTKLNLPVGSVVSDENLETLNAINLRTAEIMKEKGISKEAAMITAANEIMQ
jgi:hypothetical protein